jgi:hypothetical protein
MKWLLSLFRIGLSSVFISLLTVATTWYTVNLYVDNLLKQYNIVTPAQKQQLSQVIAALGKQAGLWTGLFSATGDSSGAAPAATDDRTGGSGLSSVPDGKSAERKPEADDPAAAVSDQDAVPVWSQQSSAQQKQGDSQNKLKDKQLVMSAQDFYNKKENLSDDDKMKIFTILAERLPQEKLQEISKFVEDGITSDELKQIESIVKTYVKPKEYEELEQILDKY